jgi:phenylalanine-4-hydroxylase
MENTNTKPAFRKFSDEENDVWRILCERQLKNLHGKASKIREECWAALGMSTDKIPDFEELNRKLSKISGWEVVMTNIVYEDSAAWIGSLHDKKLRITDFIRDKGNLDYTPLPDLFHDVFGHVPFLASPQYARIAHKFGLAMRKAKTKAEKDQIGNNWWYSFEFGLIRENGKVKALGTGLMSSVQELENALPDKVEKLPFDTEVVSSTPESPDKMHEKLFVLEGLDQIEAVVDTWLK